MDDSSSRILKFLFGFLIFVAFISCSQSTPQLNYSASSVIFEYENESDLPSSRMAVFVDLSSDARRAESITVESLSTGYIWEIDKPLKFQSDDRKYSGCTNLVMPDNKSFPQGLYKVTYIDANDDSVENDLNVSYFSNILEMNALDAEEYIRSVGGSEYWAAYDEKDILVFFGLRDGDYISVDSVWASERNAKIARPVWISSGSRTICLMPKIYKENE